MCRKPFQPGYGMCVNYLSKRIRMLLSSNLDKLGITGEQCRVISYIYESTRNGRSIYQKDIEMEFFIRRSSVTSILGNIEKSGYIIRTEDKTDARKKRVELTESGAELAKNLRCHVDGLEALLVKGMSDEEKKTLMRLLQKAIENIEECC